MDEPLDPVQARKLIREILRSGEVRFSRHALEKMAEDRLAPIDVTTVLRAGFAEPAEYENGSWRYRVRTPGSMVVVAFRSATELVLVTVWRLKR